MISFSFMLWWILECSTNMRQVHIGRCSPSINVHRTWTRSTKWWSIWRPTPKPSSASSTLESQPRNLQNLSSSQTNIIRTYYCQIQTTRTPTTWRYTLLTKLSLSTLGKMPWNIYRSCSASTAKPSSEDVNRMERWSTSILTTRSELCRWHSTMTQSLWEAGSCLQAKVSSRLQQDPREQSASMTTRLRTVWRD